MKNDLYAAVTNRVVAALEAGVTPWIRPWTVDYDPAPVNAVTRRGYRGINTLLLTLEAQERGYGRNAWMTYRQAAEVGAQVRRGESGTQVVFYKLLDAAKPTSVERLEDGKAGKAYPLLRCFTVFNVAQVNGLPERLVAKEAMASWDPHEAAEAVLRESGARIEHGGQRAFYRPADDLIQLPERGLFHDACGYYNAALHELTHWTGHATRCDRQLGKRFGDAAYSVEELVAEMGAAFLCASCYLEGRLQHASYIGHWLEVLKSDKRAVFAAAAKAQQACDFIEATCAAAKEAA